MHRRLQHLRGWLPLHRLYLSGGTSALFWRSVSQWAASEGRTGLPEESTCKHRLALPPSPVLPGTESRLCTSQAQAARGWVLDNLGCGLLITRLLLQASTLSLMPTPKGSRCGPSFEEQYLQLRSQSSLQLLLWCALLCQSSQAFHHSPHNKATTAVLQMRKSRLREFTSNEACHRPDPSESALQRDPQRRAREA